MDPEPEPDCTLVCQDGALRVNRNQLAEQSRVFSAMFTHNTKEATSGTVIVEDCSKAAMEEMYRFVCSGKVLRMNEIVEELLPVANKYGVEALEKICTKHLIISLTTENVCRRFAIANLYNYTEEKEATIDFILKYVRDIELSRFDQLNDFVLACKDGEVHVWSFLASKKNDRFLQIFHSAGIFTFDVTNLCQTSRRIVIEEYEKPIMEELYRFTCCDKDLKNLPHIAEELLPAAIEFGNETLISLCEEHIIKSLSIDNVLYRLQISQRFNRATLTTAIMKFVNDKSGSLFATGQMNDSVIMCEDGEVPVCSLLLVSQSPVFRRVFQNTNTYHIDTKTAKGFRITVENITRAIMKEVFRFVCSGEINNIDDIVEELYKAAEKYEMKKLVNVCVFIMHAWPLKMNIFRQSVLANHNIVSVKHDALKFILKNRYDIEPSVLDQFNDCLLLCEDGSVVAACSLLLGSQSVVLQEKLIRESDENYSECTFAVKFSSFTMKELYRFICCGIVENIDNNVEELLLAANEYKIKKLFDVCMFSLLSSLSVENAYRRLLLITSDSIAVEKFIVRNRGKFNLSETKPINDCLLVCEDGQVPACSFLLGSQSVAFRAILTGETEEMLTERIVFIEKFSSIAMHELYRFMCCGKVDNLEIADQLLLAAEKYNIMDLKSIIERQTKPSSVNIEIEDQWASRYNSDNCHAPRRATVKRKVSPLIPEAQQRLRLSEEPSSSSTESAESSTLCDPASQTTNRDFDSQ